MYRVIASPSDALCIGGPFILAAMTGQTSSDRLRAVMKLRGIVDAPALSALTGINVSTVRSNLNGNRQVSKATAPKYAARLRTTPEWILYGKGAGPSGQAHEPAAGPLGIVDDIAPTLRVARSQAIVTPGGTTGLAFLSTEGKAIVVELDRDAIEQIRKNLLSLEAFLGRSS